MAAERIRLMFCRGEDRWRGPQGSGQRDTDASRLPPVSEDERAGDDEGREELHAAFAALGGRLTLDELTRLLGSDAVHGALVRQAALLLDGDTAAAEDIVRDSLAALQDAWSRLGDPEQARAYLWRSVVSRSRSVRRYRAVIGPDAPEPAPDAPGAGPAAAGRLGRDAGVWALRVLPDRQREAIVLRNYMGLSEAQAAQAMGISQGAVRSHLARGMSSLRHPPGPQ